MKVYSQSLHMKRREPHRILGWDPRLDPPAPDSISVSGLTAAQPPPVSACIATLTERTVSSFIWIMTTMLEQLLYSGLTNILNGEESMTHVTFAKIAKQQRMEHQK